MRHTLSTRPGEPSSPRAPLERPRGPAPGGEPARSAAAPTTLAGPVTLSFQQVTAGYRRGLRRRPALAELSVELRAGEVTVVTGHAGAGKTTLLRLACGALRPWRGRVVRRGGGTCREGPRVGQVPDGVELPPGQTLARLLRYGAFLAGLSPTRAEAAVPAAARDARLDDALRRPLGALTPEMARRAELAFVLVQRPAVLLLEEPWRDAPPPACILLNEILGEEAARGTLVLAAARELGCGTAACDRVVALEGGRLAADLRRPGGAEGLEPRWAVRATEDACRRAPPPASMRGAARAGRVTCSGR
jgi:ABC-type multidrug transport system ATPase subunit